jgi:hypothetical protein
MASKPRKTPFAVNRGRGWHVWAGPVIVGHYRPIDGSPYVDLATVGLRETDDVPGPDGTHEVVAEHSFTGWAIRWPRFVLAFRASTRLARLPGWRTRRAAARRVRARGWRPVGGECSAPEGPVDHDESSEPG